MMQKAILAGAIDLAGFEASTATVTTDATHMASDVIFEAPRSLPALSAFLLTGFAGLWCFRGGAPGN